MTLAIIPARGGSQRIPRKNIRLFAGQPMLAHSIAACRASGAFERIVVSTEDAEIAEVARAHGAEVPFLRPAALADDHAGTDAVMAHVLRLLAEQGELPAQACCVYATAPFLRPKDLLAGRDLLAQGWDYAFSASRYPHPVFRAFTRSATEELAMLMPAHYDTRSQDLPEAWHDAAQFYWGKRDAWLEQRMLFGPRSAVVELPRWRVQDIDTPEDWEMAEILYRVLQERER